MELTETGLLILLLLAITSALLCLAFLVVPYWKRASHGFVWIVFRKDRPDDVERVITRSGFVNPFTEMAEVLWCHRYMAEMSVRDVLYDTAHGGGKVDVFLHGFVEGPNGPADYARAARLVLRRSEEEVKGLVAKAIEPAVWRAVAGRPIERLIDREELADSIVKESEGGLRELGFGPAKIIVIGVLLPYDPRRGPGSGPVLNGMDWAEMKRLAPGTS